MGMHEGMFDGSRRGQKSDIGIGLLAVVTAESIFADGDGRKTV